jgi:hypothetical protein
MRGDPPVSGFDLQPFTFTLWPSAAQVTTADFCFLLVEHAGVVWPSA